MEERREFVIRFSATWPNGQAAEDDTRVAAEPDCSVETHGAALAAAIQEGLAVTNVEVLSCEPAETENAS